MYHSSHSLQLLFTVVIFSLWPLCFPTLSLFWLSIWIVSEKVIPLILQLGCLCKIPKPLTLHQQCKLRLCRTMMRHKRTKSRLHFGLNWLRPLSLRPQLFNAFLEQPGQSCSVGRPLMKGFQMERLFRPPINPPFEPRIRQLAKPGPDAHPHHSIPKTKLLGPHTTFLKSPVWFIFPFQCRPCLMKLWYIYGQPNPALILPLIITAQ